MALTSVGFKGTVNELNWSRLSALLGSVGGVLEAAGDLAVATTGTKGQYSIQPGTVFQDGVLTDSSSVDTVPSVPLNPGNGQWYLLAQNRTWSDRVASWVIRNGPTTAAAQPGGMTVPAAFPASSTDDPGSDSDVGVAWIWLGSAAATPIIVPLLLPAPGVVPRRGTTAQRDAFVAKLTSTVQGRVYLQSLGIEWENTDYGWTERYHAEYSATYNTGGAAYAGWYPFSGLLPAVHDWRSNDTRWNNAAGNTLTVTWNGTEPVIQGCSWSRTTLTAKAPGRYRVSGACGYVGSDGKFVQVLLYKNGTVARRVQQAGNGRTSNVPFEFEVTLAVGERLAIVSRAEVGQLSMPAKDSQGGVMTWLDIDYLGPRIGNDFTA